jgi:hypothetical protein
LIGVHKGIAAIENKDRSVAVKIKVAPEHNPFAAGCINWLYSTSEIKSAYVLFVEQIQALQ